MVGKNPPEDGGGMVPPHLESLGLEAKAEESAGSLRASSTTQQVLG